MMFVFFDFVKFQMILLQKYRLKFNNISLPKFGFFFIESFYFLIT